MSRFLYPIRRLKVMPWIKYWMIKRTAGSLSEILENLTSPITLNNSLRRKFHIFEVGGNSEQESYEGRNLLPMVPAQTITANGVTATSDGKGTITILGTPTATGNLTLALEKAVSIPINTYIHLRNTGTVSSYIALGFNNGNSTKFYITFNALNRINAVSIEETVEIDRLNISITTNIVGTAINITCQPSIETTNEVTDYEPYVGGQASPNPDYPQTIRNVSGSVDVKVESGNIFNADYVPHEEQTVTFPTKEGQVLHLGDTLEDDGVHQRRFTKVFDGTEGWQLNPAGENVYYYRLTEMANNSANSLMSHYINQNTQITSMDINTFKTTGGAGNLVYIRTEYTTVEDFKAFLAQQYANGTPVTLENDLAEPIIVPYNEAQQKAYNEIKALYSYKDTTHISSDNKPSPIFKIQYVKEE